MDIVSGLRPYLPLSLWERGQEVPKPDGSGLGRPADDQTAAGGPTPADDQSGADGPRESAGAEFLTLAADSLFANKVVITAISDKVGPSVPVHVEMCFGFPAEFALV